MLLVEVYTVDFYFCSCFLDSCEAETKSFLACKELWKTEIEEKLEKLKTMERELSNKEKELLEVRGSGREREGGGMMLNK